MSGEERVPAVAEALAPFTEMMAADGYALGWEECAPGRLVVRVEATEGACADCLVPESVMAAILGNALAATSCTLDRVELPAGAAH